MRVVGLDIIGYDMAQLCWRQVVHLTQRHYSYTSSSRKAINTINHNTYLRPAFFGLHEVENPKDVDKALDQSLSLCSVSIF